MTTQEARAKGPSEPERVLRAAIVLADSAGIEALTMRNLGKAVGVEAMSLYNHVANKDDVLNGMFDLIVSEIELPSRQTLIGKRRCGRAPVFGSRDAPAATPGRSARWRAGPTHGPVEPRASTTRSSAACASAGFSIEMTVHAHVGPGRLHLRLRPAADATCPPRRPRTSRPWRSGRCATTPPRWPTTRTSSRSSAATSPRPATTTTTEFLFGLDVILDRLERLLGER